MKTSTAIITLGSLLSSALALPTVTATDATASATTNATIPWRVSSLTTKCDTDPCTYQFHMDFPGNGDEPLVDTDCMGNVALNVASYEFAACTEATLLARADADDNGITIVLQHKYGASTLYGKFTQDLHTGRPPYEFDITGQSQPLKR